ncbi:MAG: sigma-70 family RNA polymerase sigma factor [Chthonomonadales bacterium]|nr:sigma-70 family RNA polymerase sigma factor [Chthonomonadales bacterium]
METAPAAANTQQTDRAAGELLGRQREWLARFFARRVSRREDAEDLVQDVLVRASASMAAWRGDCPFSQWVLVIARRALCNYYERDPYRRGRLVPLSPREEAATLDPQREGTGAGPSLQAESRAVAERLAAHMERVCTTDERRVIALTYQGESLDEAAQFLGKSPSTVRSLYRRSRQKLLAHVVLHDPDLLGGRAAIDEAWARAAASEEAGERPTSQERSAWEDPRARLEAFRSACLKMARYLPLAAVVLRAALEHGGG